MGCLSSKLSHKLDQRTKSSHTGRFENQRSGVDDNSRPAELDALSTAVTKRRSTLPGFGKKRRSASERLSRAETIGYYSNDAATLVAGGSTEMHESSSVPALEEEQTASSRLSNTQETSETLISGQLVDQPECRDQPTFDPAQPLEMEISRATDSGLGTFENVEQKTPELERHHHTTLSRECSKPTKKRTSLGKTQTHPDSSRRPQPLIPVRNSGHKHQHPELVNNPKEGKSNKPASTHTPSSLSFPSPTITSTPEYTPQSSSADLSSDSNTTNHPFQQNVGHPPSSKQSQKPPSRTHACHPDATHIPSRYRLGSYSSEDSLSNIISPHHAPSHSSSMTTTPHDSSDCVNDLIHGSTTRAPRIASGGRTSLNSRRKNEKRSGYRASKHTGRRRHQDNPLGHFPIQGVNHNVFNMAPGSNFSGIVNHTSQNLRFERYSGTRRDMATVVPSNRVGHEVKREKRRRE